MWAKTSRRRTIQSCKMVLSEKERWRQPGILYYVVTAQVLRGCRQNLKQWFKKKKTKKLPWMPPFRDIHCWLGRDIFFIFALAHIDSPFFSFLLRYHSHTIRQFFFFKVNNTEISFTRLHFTALYTSEGEVTLSPLRPSPSSPPCLCPGTGPSHLSLDHSSTVSSPPGPPPLATLHTAPQHAPV